MSLLVVANADRPLTRICQVVGHFLAHRRRKQPDRAIEPLLGIWLAPSPLATVNALSQTHSRAEFQPLIQESFGHEGEWYVCRLATDPGPPGEIETLVGLLGLLLAEGGPDATTPGQALAPYFDNTTPDDRIPSLLEDLAGQFPGAVTRAVTRDGETDRLVPHPDLSVIQPN